MTEPLSKKRQLAVTRNRMKFRLMGMKLRNINNSSLTTLEQLAVSLINIQIDNLLRDWDSQSIELGLKPRPIYEIRDSSTNKLLKTTKDINEVKMLREDTSVIIVKQK